MSTNVPDDLDGLNDADFMSKTHQTTSRTKREIVESIEAALVATQRKLAAFKLQLTESINVRPEELQALEAAHQAKMDEIQQENEALLNQLYTVQEFQEELLLRDTIKNEQIKLHQKRLDNILKKYPDHWEVEKITVKSLPDMGMVKAVQWDIVNAYLGNNFISEINLQTHLTNGKVDLLIQRRCGAAMSDIWVKWPPALIKSDILPCMPSAGPVQQGNNAVLSALGTSDWGNLKTLVKRMAKTLKSESVGNDAEDINKILKKGLTDLGRTLESWPLVLRYDNIEITTTTQTDMYQSLNITLENLSLGTKKWPKLEYSIATYDAPGEFGQQPRLEFPESGRDIIEHWFAESEDRRGLRLELRFAMPNVMDTNVWGALSNADRVLIVALISDLPNQFTHQQSVDPSVSENWQSWYVLAKTLKDIITHNIHKSRNQ